MSVAKPHAIPDASWWGRHHRALSDDQRQDSVLAATHVDHQLFVYPGLDYLAMRTSPAMFQRVRDWYHAHGLFQSGQTNTREACAIRSPMVDRA